MADNVMAYRLTVKEVAQEFGIYATFMPKPVAGVNGSGMHTHQSLFEGDRNAFFDATDEYHLSKTAKRYIAGLLRHAPEITLRHQPVGELLQAVGAGVRGAGVRVLGATQPQRAGARAAVQAGQGGRHPDRVPLARRRVQPVPGLRRDARGRAHRGRERLRAAARGSNNIYEMTDDERGAAGIASLPEDLVEAIHLAEGSEVLREALGDHVHEYLIRNKREEWDAFKAYVSPFELERYLPIL